MELARSRTSARFQSSVVMPRATRRAPRCGAARLEQASWDRLCPKGNGARVSGEKEGCDLQRRLTDRLAEGFEAVGGNYVCQCPLQECFAGTRLLLWNILCRIRADDAGHRGGN
jgi:hypothetical protein